MNGIDITNQVNNSVYDALNNSVWNSVYTSVWDSVQRSEAYSVSNPTWNRIGDSVEN